MGKFNAGGNPVMQKHAIQGGGGVELEMSIFFTNKKHDQTGENCTIFHSKDIVQQNA